MPSSIKDQKKQITINITSVPTLNKKAGSASILLRSIGQCLIKKPSGQPDPYKQYTHIQNKPDRELNTARFKAGL